MNQDTIQFIQWCFRDTGSSIMTLMVIGAVCGGIASIIRAINPGPVVNNYYDAEDKEDNFQS